MLITSPCGEFALLGRKSGWPAGRYSTLAGFAEVGETLEHCVVREVFEESGILKWTWTRLPLWQVSHGHFQGALRWSIVLCCALNKQIF